MMGSLGVDIDIRTDVPMYNIYRHGELVEQTPDISDFWRNDFVTFVIGCSFTFEMALMAKGIRLHHVDANKTVSMYRTSLKAGIAGPFDGPIVVSMRPMYPVDAIRASADHLQVSPCPRRAIHIGDGADIGIKDISKPDWGDSPVFENGQIPVFWACGVTPQAAMQSAKLPICITHAPGRMLITDIPSWATASI